MSLLELLPDVISFSSAISALEKGSHWRAALDTFGVLEFRSSGFGGIQVLGVQVFTLSGFWRSREYCSYRSSGLGSGL